MREFNLKAYTNCDGKAKKASILLMKTKGYEVLGPADKEYYKNFDLSFKHSITKKMGKIEKKKGKLQERISELENELIMSLTKKDSNTEEINVAKHQIKINDLKKQLQEM